MVVFTMVLFSVFGIQKAFAQGVGISEIPITADPSAILELRYRSGSFKGFLAPRMDSVQRKGIASPKQGLLVYPDTDYKSFWYFDGVWKSITSANISLGTANQLLGVDSAV